MDTQDNQTETLVGSTFIVFNIRSGGATHDLINEIGIAYVKNGKLHDTFFTELSPPPNRELEFRNKWDDFSPRLSVAWDDIKEYFNLVDYVTAFNLSIHKSNLEKSLKVYGIDLPEKKYFCAYNFAKDNLKKVPKATLENVCSELEISIGKSSDYTLSRAIASAEVVIKIEEIAKMTIDKLFIKEI